MLVGYAQSRRRKSGFTLIELLTTMLIVAVLASVSIPMYAGYVARARRADARTQLLQVAQFMQRFYAASDSYLQDRAGNGVLSQIPSPLQQSPADSGRLYELVIPEATLTHSSYEIRMVPVAGGIMQSDQCGAFSLTSTGVRAVLTGAAPGNAALRDTCWK